MKMSSRGLRQATGLPSLSVLDSATEATAAKREAEDCAAVTEVLDADAMTLSYKAFCEPRSSVPS